MSGDQHSHSSHSGHSADDVRSHLKLYWAIGAALFVLTVVTVAVAKFEIEAFFIALAIALVIAIVKGSLVAAVFMHLMGEKKIIWWTLALCAVFFAVLIALPVMTHEDQAGDHIAPLVDMGAHGEHEATGEAEGHAEAAGQGEKEAAPAEAH